MSKQPLQLDKLEDLLTIDVEKLKSPEKSKVLTRLKALIQLENKVEAKTTEEAIENLPYKAAGVVGNTLVDIRFDLESKKARVVDTQEDTRPMVMAAEAVKRTQSYAKSQKGE